MKRLFIIRHAKSSWKDVSLDDYERPLNKRGYRDAPFMGKLLKEKNIKPDIILSSPAKRAKCTAEVIAKETGYKNKIDFDDELYESTPNMIDAKIKSIDSKHHTAFLFGHNPELNMLAHKYVGFNENIVTCAAVEVEFDCESWEEIDSSNAKLVSFKYPKKYK